MAERYPPPFHLLTVYATRNDTPKKNDLRVEVRKKKPQVIRWIRPLENEQQQQQQHLKRSCVFVRRDRGRAISLHRCQSSARTWLLSSLHNEPFLKGFSSPDTPAVVPRGIR